MSKIKTSTVAKMDVHQFVSDSQDVGFIKSSFGQKMTENFDSFFVVIGDGDYEEVWGIVGIFPALENTVYKVK